ncbi:hypothetical protein N7466_011057 [Penicillium verhagenii]|uniref:uncharacterized protein n=1 Tax=Penicillium verhagenii TaxID=1562060 RepID=UPI002544E623|nr:uncharacterized protein N7466_011057 [Penicillium verhagenii]KAJ5917503.1 hypothetical protein N7466_011057 [Penicillium verhagenii]
MGPLMPPEGENSARPRFAQSYFIGIEPELLAKLDRLIRQSNPYYTLFHTAFSFLHENSERQSLSITPQLRLIGNEEGGRQYDLPTGQVDVAAFLPTIPDEYSRRSYRDIQSYLRRAPVWAGAALNLQNNPATQALTQDEVGIIPFGNDDEGEVVEHGDDEIPEDNRDPFEEPEEYHVGERFLIRIQRDHALYMPLALNLFQRANLLVQQYIVDGWVAEEGRKLEFIRYNQDIIRRYDAHMRAKELVKLPTSLTGSKRWLRMKLKDSMALLEHYNRPELFITVTANPDWDEVKDSLLPDNDGTVSQGPRDRPDMIARVFNLKLKAIMKEIQDGIFRPYQAHVYVVEFQKRGLPYAHMLIWLAGGPYYDRSETIDQIGVHRALFSNDVSLGCD